MSLHRIYAGRTPYGPGFWDNRQAAQAGEQRHDCTTET